MLPIDYAALAALTVETLKPIIRDVTVGVGAHALWDWLKAHLHGKGAEALESVAKNPDDTDEWEALALRIKLTIAKDPTLAKELTALLPGGGGSTQTAFNSGDNANVIQASGTGIQISANRGAGTSGT